MKVNKDIIEKSTVQSLVMNCEMPNEFTISNGSWFRDITMLSELCRKYKVRRKPSNFVERVLFARRRWRSTAQQHSIDLAVKFGAIACETAFAHGTLSPIYDSLMERIGNE